MGCGPPSFYISLNVSLLAPVLPLFYGNSLSFAPAASALLVLLSFLPVHSPLFRSRLTAVAARLGDTAWVCMAVWNIFLPPVFDLKYSLGLC